MDSAFITGGTGFVGASVVRVLLDRGFKVRALARKGSNRKNLESLQNLEIIEGGVSDKEALKKGSKGARFVFHVAADYRLWIPGDPQEMYEANVRGTQNVIEEAQAAGVEKIVHCSSVAAIKLKPGGVADETSEYADESAIISHYKKSKWLAEQAALNLAKKGVPVVVVNPSTPIGPYDVKPTPTGKIIVDFLNGRMPSYIDTGLNIVHVRDVAEGHYLAALRGRVGQRYILGGENMTLKRMLELLSSATGLRVPRFKTPYAVALAFGALDTARARIFGGEPLAPLDAVRMAKNPMYFDSSKAVQELGLPQTPAAKALSDAVEWFYANGYAAEPIAAGR